VSAERHLKVMPTALEAGADAIGRQITVSAPPDVVFSYFTDPKKHLLWQGTAVDIDPRPGGRMRIEFGPGYVALGEYVEVDPPARLVYTWGWEQEGSSALPAGSSTVEVTLTADGDATIVRLRHSGLPIETHAFHGDGWNEGLKRLGSVLAERR
jgi:uncharacterized protein YndB with AHSA1/START domain